MNFLFPILAAFLQTGSVVLDKTILSFKKFDFRTYVGVSFPLSFFITLFIFILFRPPLSVELFFGWSLGLILLSCAITIITNVLYYRALSFEDLSEMETLGLLTAIPAIIFSSFIFPDERNYYILIPALVSSLAILWSHWEKRHFKIAKKTLPFFIWAFSAAPLSAALSKVLLISWNPISLEVVRSGITALAIWLMFAKAAKRVSIRNFSLLFLTNIFTTVAWLLFYFSYQRLGIVHTALLFSLQPFLVYASAVLILKEPFHWKKTIAFLVVLLSIAAAQVMS
ncbi:EamA family transporter [Candidatus Giovannonibacteria bacterium]|nr:EamA family transporter [Candidatus Giovannonibacteria bacterium]